MPQVKVFTHFILITDKGNIYNKPKEEANSLDTF